MNFVEVKDFSLKQYNTLRLESVASKVIFPLNGNGIKEAFEFFEEKKIIVLGNGSNVLFSKNYYDDSYVFMIFKLMDNIEINKDNIMIESGTTLSKLSWFALENGIEGYEFLEDVPGSLGGAVIMNAGTYKDNIGQFVKKISYYDISKNEIVNEEVSTYDFGRRESKWTKMNCVILSAELLANEEMKVDNYEKIIEKILLIKKNRYLKQPRNFPNAGSVFKRPNLNGQDYYVWELFEQLGLRGYKKNGAMISSKHPGFIVNINNARPEDVLHIIEIAQKKVDFEYGIKLELEWKII